MNKTTKTIIGLVILIIIVLAIYLGTSKKTTQAPIPTTPPTTTKEPIKIGFMGPFSGYAAQFGEMMERGLNLALSELPEEIRERIKIIKEDDMCTATPGLNAAQKLIQIDKVNYVIGPLCNEVVLASEHLFEDNKVVALTIGLPSSKIANMGPYHFSFSPEIEYLMKSLAKKVRDDNISKIAVVYINKPFEVENRNHFIKYFKEFGGEVVADEAIERGTTDVRTPILKIKSKNPEAIFIGAHSGELINILRQLKELGLENLPKYGIHATENPVILSEAADLSDGLIYPYPAEKTQSQSAIDYARKYREMYNLDPDPYSANVYDSLKILVGTIEVCGYENKDCVLQKLSTIKDYPGANGLLSVDERGVGTYKEIMLKIVKNGKFEKLQK
jgi:branched-chain amino acid transport system substrate-binding protein